MRGDLHFRIIESVPPTPAARSAVVLVHGIGMSHRYFDRLHRELARSVRVISVDLPGFGGLPKPGRDVDIEEMAHALAHVLAPWAASIDAPLTLVGHSMGAQWAVELAARHPPLVGSVIAIGPVADDRHPTLLAQARALAVDTLGEGPATNVIVFTDYLRCGPRWYLTQVRHMLAYRTRERMRALVVPVLVVRGGRDPVAGPGWCRRLAGERGVSLVEIGRRRHVVQRSAAPEVAAAILAHAESVGSRLSPPDDQMSKTST